MRSEILSLKLFTIFGFYLMALSSSFPWITALDPYAHPLWARGFELGLVPEASISATIFLIISGGLIVWFYEKIKRIGVVCLGMGIWMLIETIIDFIQLPSKVTYFSHIWTNMYDVERLTVAWISVGIFLQTIGMLITMVGSIKLLVAKPDYDKIEVSEARLSKNAKELYEQLLDRYMILYGDSRRILDYKIKSLNKKGYCGEEAIKELAKQEKLIEE